MKKIIKYIVSIILLVLLLSFIDWQQGLSLLLRAKTWPIALAFILFVTGLVVSSLKWKILLDDRGPRVSLWRLFRYYWIGAFLSNFMPTSIGGDVGRVYYLRYLGNLTLVLSSIVLERFTGVIALLLLCLVSVIARPYFIPENIYLPFTLGLSLILFLTLLLIFLPQFITKGLFKVKGFWRGRASEFIDKLINLHDAVSLYRNRYLVLSIALLLSGLFYLIIALSHKMLIYSLGFNVAFIDVLLIIPLINVAYNLPISINAIGVAEGAFVLFYTQVGLSPSEALALAVMGRFVRMTGSGLGGIFWFVEKPQRG